MKNASAKFAKVRVLGFIAIIALPLWVAISQGPIGKFYDAFNKKYFENSPFLALGVWLVITILLYVLYEWRESLISSQRLSADEKRIKIIGLLKKAFKDRILQKLASDAPFEINLSLTFSNQETRKDIVDWYIIDGIDGQEIDSFESLFEFYTKDIKRLAIIGDPGAGKSMLLLKFAIELLNIAEKDETAPIPFVLDLATLNFEDIHNSMPRERSLFDRIFATSQEDKENYNKSDSEKFSFWVESSVSSRCTDLSIPTDWGVELIDKNQVILIFDGFDEISGAGNIFSATERYLHAMYHYIEELSHKGNLDYPECIITSRIDEFKNAQERASFLPVNAILKIDPIKNVDDELNRMILKKAKGTAYHLKRATDYYPELRNCIKTAFNLHLALKLSKEHYDFGSIKNEEGLLDAYMYKRLEKFGNTFSTQDSIDTMHWFAKNSDNLKFSKLSINSNKLNKTWLFDQLRFFAFFPLIIPLIYFAIIPFREYILSNPNFKSYINIQWHPIYALSLAWMFVFIPFPSDRRNSYGLYREHYNRRKVISNIVINAVGIIFLVTSLYFSNLYSHNWITFFTIICLGVYSYEHINGAISFRVRSYSNIRKVLLLDTLNVTICLIGLLSSVFVSLMFLFSEKNSAIVIDLAKYFSIVIPTSILYAISLTVPGSYVFDGWLTQAFLGYKRIIVPDTNLLLNEMKKEGLLEYSNGDYRFRHMLIQDWFIRNSSLNELEFIKEESKIVGVRNSSIFNNNDTLNN